MFKLFKENPLMVIAMIIIMLLITAMFYFLWNRKTLVEKLALEEGIKLRVTKAKKVKEIAPSFIKEPVNKVYSIFEYFFTEKDSNQSGVEKNEKGIQGSSSNSERECKEIVERLFKKKFLSVRPDWLKNPMTNRNLELDMYNEELKLAFEYDGKQHREFSARWHNSEDDFNDQVLRDKMKNKLCRLKGVTLIRVPDNCGDMEKFIKKECVKREIHL